MSLHLRLAAAAASAAVLALQAAPAHATVYEVNITGTLSGAWDNAGIFGPARTLLNGKAFSIRYQIDDAVPGVTVYAFAPTERQTVGTFATNPVLGWLTVNGITRQVQPLEGRLYVANDHGLTPHDVIGIDARSDNFDGGIYYDDWISFGVFDASRSLVDGLSLPMALSYSAPGALTFSGNFRFQNSRAGYLASGDFNTTGFSITAQVPPPVPEPGTALLLVAGLAGLALRRRAQA